MLQADRRRIEPKADSKSFAKRTVVLIGLISANAVLLSLSFFLTKYDWIPVVLVTTLAALHKYLLNYAYVELNKDSESRLPQFGERMIVLFLPKGLSECMLGDLLEEYTTIHAEFGASRARIWFYKQLVTSLRPLLWRNLEVVVRTRIRILTDANRKDA
jgi:hypothetical protein